MQQRNKWFLLLAVFYSLASLAHFAHNAEYIAYYPGLPVWMTRESVYLAWLGVACVGGIALLATKMDFHRLSLVLFMAYGLLGVDGLLHYTLALCSEHTLGSNITIGAEVVLGLTLACTSAVKLSRIVLRTHRVSV
jgi:hypothetical protein